MGRPLLPSLRGGDLRRADWIMGLSVKFCFDFGPVAQTVLSSYGTIPVGDGSDIHRTSPLADGLRRDAPPVANGDGCLATNRFGKSAINDKGSIAVIAIERPAKRPRDATVGQPDNDYRAAHFTLHTLPITELRRGIRAEAKSLGIDARHR
jgi:hypothetical protein